MSVILVTHDLGVVAGLCDRIFVMYAGRLVETGPAADIYPHPEHPYTAGLLKSIIRPGADRAQRLQAIEGLPPVLVNPRPGCSFAPRCSHAQDRCHTETPTLTPRGDGRAAACFITEGQTGGLA